MRSCYLLVWAITCCLLPLAALAGQSLDTESGATHTNITRSLSDQSIAFTKNMGQWPDSLLFRASAGGTTMWFTKDGIWYQFTKHIKKNATGEEALAAGLGPRRPDLSGGLGNEPDSVETDMVKAQFVAASPNAEVVGLEEQAYRCNYFLGNDPAKWHTDVPNYSAVTFKEIYPGVEATFRRKNGRLEYMLSGPAEAIEKVQTTYSGAPASSQPDGSTVLSTRFGEKRFDGLLLASGEPEPVAVNAANSTSSVTLVYSTYLGGSDSDAGRGIAVDGQGSAYVTGWTHSVDFPTRTPYQAYPGDLTWNVFVTKLSSGGNSLVYSTYLGGGNRDEGWGIAVDGQGSAYVTGSTWSTDFPTQAPYQTNSDGGNTDAFVAKLSPAGNSLVYSTYLGGTGDDACYGITLDGSRNAYVTGYTASTNYPTEVPYQTDQGDGYEDAFVSKLSPSGSSLLYSTYLGGSSWDEGLSIAVDAAGSAYVTGWTHSVDFPTQNPYQAYPGDLTWNVFVTKLSSGGNSLVYSTYLGGNGWDSGYDIAVDAQGNAYVTGSTSSVDFPTQTPYQTYQSSVDVFVTKLSAAGTSLVYSTYLGGNSYDYGYGIAVDGQGNAYVTGSTSSVDFPTQTPYQTYQSSVDVFVTKLSAAGNSLGYSTYLGGASDDYGQDIAVDAVGSAHVTGHTNSVDFPTQTPYQTHQGPEGYADVLVTKLVGSCVKPLLVCSGDTLTCDSTVASATVEVTNAGDLGTYSYSWIPAPISGQGTEHARYDAPGLKKVIVTAAAQCIDSCDVTIQEFFPGPIIIATGDTLTCDSDYASVKVTVLNEGSLGPLTYFWNPPPFSGQGTNHARYSLTGWKEVIVTNVSSGCKSMVSAYVAFDNSKPDADNDGLGDGCDNCPLTANITQTDLNLDGIGDACQGSAALTTVGTNVTATPVPGVTLVFASVSYGGVTELLQDNGGAPPPSGFTVYPTISPCWYQIETNAHFSGPITICFHYNEATLTAPEDQLKLYHYDGGWIDITSSRDPVGNNICGTTTSLSPFILAEPVSCCTGTTGNVNTAGIVDLADLSLLIAYLTASPRPTLPCPAEANVNSTGIIDLSDLSLLIAYLTASPRPNLPNCP